MKRFLAAFFLLLCPVLAVAEASSWPFDVTTIAAHDGSITAKYVSVGATMTELWVRDRNNTPRDVILGYDDNTKLLTDPIHPVFNAIAGRYESRIKNGTFSIPITKDPQPDGPNVYHIALNDHDGRQSIHGGLIGWDRRNWTIVARSPTSVTYKHFDPADEGFPGNVTVFVTHQVENGGILKTTAFATATEKTPIMVTQHIYWNLDAFQDGVDNVLNHTIHVDSSKIMSFDGDEIPTGDFFQARGTPFDFTTPRQIGSQWSINDTIDNCFIYDRSEEQRVGTTLWSDVSGIKLEISTSQPAVQLFSTYFFEFANLTRKAVHGGPDKIYGAWAGVAIEQEHYLDAINTPEWGIDQIYHPGRTTTRSQSTPNSSLAHTSPSPQSQMKTQPPFPCTCRR